jgi:hypothetical protein
MASFYKKLIEEIRKENNLTVPVNVVEASMRLQYSTLDHLPRETFKKEAILAEKMWKEDKKEMLALAKSYSL